MADENYEAERARFLKLRGVEVDCVELRLTMS